MVKRETRLSLRRVVMWINMWKTLRSCVSLGTLMYPCVSLCIPVYKSCSGFSLFPICSSMVYLTLRPRQRLFFTAWLGQARSSVCSVETTALKTNGNCWINLVNLFLAALRANCQRCIGKRTYLGEIVPAVLAAVMISRHSTSLNLYSQARMTMSSKLSLQWIPNLS